MACKFSSKFYTAFINVRGVVLRNKKERTEMKHHIEVVSHLQSLRRTVRGSVLIEAATIYGDLYEGTPEMFLHKLTRDGFEAGTAFRGILTRQTYPEAERVCETIRIYSPREYFFTELYICYALT